MNAHTRILFSELIDLWRQPAELGSAELAYIDSFFLKPSAAQLQRELDLGSNPDIDWIEQLLFSPGEQLQIELEPLIEKNAWTDKDRINLRDALAAEKIRARFFFPAGRGSICVLMSPQTAAAVVARLHLDRQLHPRVLSTLEASVHRELRPRAKRYFRNSRFVWTESRAEFLCRFFETLRSDDFFAHLAFVVGFLDELPPGEDIQEELFKKKRSLFSHTQLAGRAAERRRTGTMETIIGSGIRIPFTDPGECIRLMKIIDRITADVFGRVEDFDRLVFCEETALAAGDVDSVFRLLR